MTTRLLRQAAPCFRQTAARCLSGFGRLAEYLAHRLILVGLVAAVIAGPAAAQDAQNQKPPLPPPEMLATMIKSTVIAFNQGNMTGNYTVLRDLAAPGFREANSPNRLAEIFKSVRDKRIDFSPVVLLQPKMIKPPEIDKDGDLILDGYFDTRPQLVRFFLVFRLVQNTWQLFAIRVDAVPAAPDAPPASAVTPNPPIVVDTNAASKFITQSSSGILASLARTIDTYVWAIAVVVMIVGVVLIAFLVRLAVLRRRVQDRHPRDFDTADFVDALGSFDEPPPQQRGQAQPPRRGQRGRR